MEKPWFVKAIMQIRREDASRSTPNPLSAAIDISCHICSRKEKSTRSNYYTFRNTTIERIFVRKHKLTQM